MSTKPRLPRAVAESGALAENVAAQLAGTAAPVAADPAPEIPDPASAPEVADPAPATAPTPTHATADLPTPEEWAKFQQRHRTLQGSFNALNERHRETASSLQHMQEKLSAAPAAPAVDAAIVEETVKRIRDGLGEELQELIDTRVAHLLDQRLATHVSPLKDVVASTLQVSQQQAREVFWDRLDVLAPEWEQLNTDPGFLRWLDQIDPASGVPLKAHMADADSKLDANRTALFFTAYLRERDKTRAPTPTPRPETQGGPTPRPNQPKLIARKDIAKYYSDLQRGVYRGREAEAVAIEQEIMNAQRDGRVVD